jgi:hypothetical protein
VIGPGHGRKRLALTDNVVLVFGSGQFLEVAEPDGENTFGAFCRSDSADPVSYLTRLPLVAQNGSIDPQISVDPHNVDPHMLTHTILIHTMWIPATGL